MQIFFVLKKKIFIVCRGGSRYVVGVIPNIIFG